MRLIPQQGGDWSLRGYEGGGEVQGLVIRRKKGEEREGLGNLRGAGSFNLGIIPFQNNRIKISVFVYHNNKICLNLDFKVLKKLRTPIEIIKIFQKEL